MKKLTKEKSITTVKKLLSLLLAAAMLLSITVGLDLSAYAATSGDYEYSVTNGKAEITHYSGSATNLTIPSKLGGYTVAKICAGAIVNGSFTNVNIPNGVTSIDGYAFLDCKNLKSVTIPSSVTYIAPWAFMDCLALKDIYYSGTKSQWNRINIGEYGNEWMINAKIHYADQGKWLKSGNRWWYRHADGSYTKNAWEKIDGKWYHFDKSGWMQTGWLKDGGKWYYLNSSGVMTTGWQKISGKWYYMNSSGVMQTGWLKLGGKWYYMNSSGVMLTGRQKIGNKWYTFNSSGVWVK